MYYAIDCGGFLNCELWVTTYDLRVSSYVETASCELFLLEPHVTSYKLNFETASYKKVLRVKLSKCVLLGTIASYLRDAS